MFEESLCIGVKLDQSVFYFVGKIADPVFEIIICKSTSGI